MIYFLDTEFNGFGGELMSLGLVRQDGESLYLVYTRPVNMEDWVEKNVEPILYSVPEGATVHDVSWAEGSQMIADFLRNDRDITIITDWPDDIRYFCQAIITGPGMMVNLDNIAFRMVRVDAYPTKLEGAVQHNALWDAMSLKEKWMNP